MEVPCERTAHPDLRAIAHHKVLAVVVKQIDVMPGHITGQARTHFAGEDLVP